ncbi:nucleotidyltransferase family protein [Caulobacter sp.]|uniref:nucleotidyltransferase family protein n=1 Tax=Caulobacter sp. TaxID=78 RepID=UPI003BADA454
MNRDAVIAVLRAAEAALRAMGVSRAALFGSTARGEARPDSDLDIFVELDPAAKLDLYDYVGITQYIAGLFAAPVDVVDRAGLKAHVRPSAERDAVYAFGLQ